MSSQEEFHLLNSPLLIALLSALSIYVGRRKTFLPFFLTQNQSTMIVLKPLCGSMLLVSVLLDPSAILLTNHPILCS